MQKNKMVLSIQLPDSRRERETWGYILFLYSQ